MKGKVKFCCDGTGVLEVDRFQGSLLNKIHTVGKKLLSFSHVRKMSEIYFVREKRFNIQLFELSTKCKCVAFCIRKI